MTGSAALGIDAGGTKTDGVLVTPDGEVVGRARRGPANYQAVGRVTAKSTYRSICHELTGTAETRGLTIRSAAYGLSGEDRPKDRTRLVRILEDIDPTDGAWTLVNDTYLVLRAGTLDGVGVAVVSGTGSNCVGTGPAGATARVGGFAREFGDDGSGTEIGTDGLRAAFRGHDGRGPTTALTGLLMKRFSLDRLDDFVDFFLADATGVVDVGQLAPLVCEAAAGGDVVAAGILAHAGDDLGLSAVIVARQLFDRDAEFPLVLGGSVLQKGASDAMRDALVARVHREFPAAEARVPNAPPILGAALLALDRLYADDPAAFPSSWPAPETADRIARQLQEIPT